MTFCKHCGQPVVRDVRSGVVMGWKHERSGWITCGVYDQRVAFPIVQHVPASPTPKESP